MKKIRRMSCLVLAFFFVSVAPIQVGAVTSASDQSFELLITKLNKENPDAVINVENGVIHVYVPTVATCVQDFSVGAAISGSETIANASTTSIYAPDGGIWGTSNDLGIHGCSRVLQFQVK